MGETGREPSCVQDRPVDVVGEIASSYLLQADGNPSLALRTASYGRMNSFRS